MAATGNLCLSKICKVLDTYRGRDKVLRLLCYISKLVGAVQPNGKSSRAFKEFSKQMSATRATLRLLDDLPMLKHSLDYGWGSKEPDRLMAMLGVTANVVDQIFYPIEKMAWFAEHDLFDGINQKKWNALSSVCWVTSIYVGLIRTVRLIITMEKHKTCINLKNDERLTVRQLSLQQYYEILTCFRLCMDFVHAVNTLPKGYLWSSKLNDWQIGLIATASSLIGLYQMFRKTL